jgi:hypothetical protein
MSDRKSTTLVLISGLGTRVEIDIEGRKTDLFGGKVYCQKFFRLREFFFQFFFGQKSHYQKKTHPNVTFDQVCKCDV